MSTPPIDEKALLILRDEIDVLKGLLEEIVTAVMMAGVSNYPIFIAHKGETMDLGRPLAEDREGMDWQFRISHLEEMVHKGVIVREHVDAFRERYKSADQHYTFLVLHKTQHQWLFVPKA